MSKVLSRIGTGKDYHHIILNIIRYFDVFKKSVPLTELVKHQ